MAFFIKLGQAISYCQVYDDKAEGIVLSSAGFLFLIFFFLRLELDTYANLFHASDVVSRILYFMFMMGIGAMAISMPGDGEAEGVDIRLRSMDFTYYFNTYVVSTFFLLACRLLCSVGLAMMLIVF